MRRMPSKYLELPLSSLDECDPAVKRTMVDHKPALHPHMCGDILQLSSKQNTGSLCCVYHSLSSLEQMNIQEISISNDARHSSSTPRHASCPLPNLYLTPSWNHRPPRPSPQKTTRTTAMSTHLWVPLSHADHHLRCLPHGQPELWVAAPRG